MDFSRILTPWRLKWYSISILFALLAALIIAIVTSTGTRTITGGRLGGDFTSFYAIGRMVAESGFTEIYDKQKQIESQNGLLPYDNVFLPFPYPPYVALACIPLSLFSYHLAYAIHVFVSIGAFYLTFFNLRKLIPEVDRFFLPAFTVSLSFIPIFGAVFNGQLTAFILMLYSFVWRFTKHGKPYLAGFFMGLLLFKPQFAIPLIGLFVLSGRLKIASTAILTSLLIISMSLLVTGIQPYKEWVDFLKWFVPADALINKHNAVSWIGFIDAIFGTDNKMAIVTGYLFCIVTVLFISCIWAIGGKISDFDAQMGLAAVCFILIPSHVMFYDAGLILLTYSTIIGRIHSRRLELICLVWLIGITQVFADRIGFSFIFFLVIFTFILSLFYLTMPAMKKSMAVSTTENYHK